MKISKNCQKPQFPYSEKGALKLRWAAPIKPRQIKRSGLFLLDQNGQTRVYRLALGPTDVPVQRKRDSPVEEDDCPHVN